MASVLAVFIADLAFGDPPGRFHPVRLLGWCIARAEPAFRRAFPTDSRGEYVSGALFTLAIASGSMLLVRAIVAGAGALHPALRASAATAAGWSALATRSLLEEAWAVIAALERDDLATARERLARIVGRDTGALDQSDIARAVIETLAESTCDGIAAPLFYFAIGGPAAAFGYRALNTLDSMIGHRDAPYTFFGRCAARADDVANVIPARLAALAILAAGGLLGRDVRRTWRVWLRDGLRHASPNAGQSEAAMAGVLGVRLGGTNYYAGVRSKTPMLGAEFRVAELRDARSAVLITGLSAVLCCAAAEVLARVLVKGRG